MKNGQPFRSRPAAGWFSLASFLLLSFLSLAGCGSSSGDPVPTTTVLIYIEGTNLETDYARATANIREMLAATPADHLNVVLETGAAGKSVAADPVKSWRTVKRHLIKDGAIQELQDLGALNMGAASVLTDFIRWGQAAFPADKYILIFWDHGGGPLWGFGGDLDTDTDPLQVTQIRQAIGAAVAASGKGFELIGFDACLMATAEIAANLAPFARYLVASEELEPGAGWNYTPFLNALAAEPNADGLAAGTTIAKGYAEKTDPETDTYTLSVIDLSRIDAVVAAIEEFSVLALDQLSRFGRPAWNQLAAVRNLADEFGANRITNIYNNATDLGHFALLAGEAGAVYRQSAARLQAAVAQAVRYNVKSEGHPAASGLSFYFPFHKLAWEQEYFSRYEAVSFSPTYRTFLKPFIAYPLDHPPGAALTISDPIEEPTALRATVTSPYGIGEQFITLAQAAPGNRFTMLGMDLASVEPAGNDRFDLTYPRDTRWFTLDGHHVTVYFEYQEKGGIYALTVPALYRPQGTPAEKNRPVNLGVRYDTAANRGIIREAWEGIQPSGISSRTEVDLNTGDIITPIFLTIDFSTSPETITYSTGTPFPMSDEKLIFSRSPVSAGTYHLFFRLQDLAGNLEISNPITVFTAPAADRTARDISRGQEAMPLPPDGILRQGFWNDWKH